MAGLEMHEPWSFYTPNTDMRVPPVEFDAFSGLFSTIRMEPAMH